LQESFGQKESENSICTDGSGTILTLATGHGKSRIHRAIARIKKLAKPALQRPRPHWGGRREPEPLRAKMLLCGR